MYFGLDAFMVKECVGYIVGILGLDVDVLWVVIKEVINTCGLCWVLWRCECRGVRTAKEGEREFA
jgi:hypothetical protein